MDPRRLKVEGPVLVLPRASVQLLSLALHELATNAVKHGALKDEHGTLAIAWYVDEPNSSICLEWFEEGDSAAIPSDSGHRGFGRRLLEEALPRQLGAKTHFESASRGFKCVINIPS